MRICQVIDSLNVGGAERVCVDMCNLLEENKCNFHFLVLVSKGELFNDLNVNVDYTILNRTNKYSISKFKETRDVIKQFDIIHCHFKHVYKYIRMVSLLFKMQKLKIVLHDHGKIDFKNKNHRFLKTFLTPKFYIAVSQNQIDFLSIKKNVVNFFLLKNIISETHNKYDLNRGYDLVLVSNIKREKNQQFAAKFAAYYSLSILFIGKNQDETYFNILKDYCNKANITYSILENVNNAQAYLHNAKVGLHVSKSETGPLVLLEYMCKGIPFIAYNTGEIAQYVKSTYSDLIKDTFDLKTWFETFNTIKSDHSKSEKLRSFFNDHYSKDEYYNKLMSIYMEIQNQ